MSSLRINVLETYDLKFCCVCTQNGETLYLNIFESVIIFRDIYISLAQIINETLNLSVSYLSTNGRECFPHEILRFQVQEHANQFQEVCINCKNKIVDFFVFKKRTEEARISRDPSALEPPVKKMLLEVVDQIENNLSSPDQYQEEIPEVDVAELIDDQILDECEMKEEFLEVTDVDSVQEDLEGDYQDDLNSDREESAQTVDETTQEIVEEIEDCSEVNCESPEGQTFLVDGLHTIINKPSTRSSTSRKKSVRRSNPESWIRNRRKLAKNTGQSYVASNGKLIEAKQMKTNCGESCRMHCSKKISEENRFKNFTHFYELADIAKQRKFLFDHMKTYEPKRSKIPKNPQKVRAVQRCYFLDRTHENDASELIQVCKLMFLNTFSISSQMIDTLYRKAINEGEFNDTRGKFERKQSRAHEFCVQHVEKYPYAKLEPNTSVTKLYEMYVEECQQSGVEAMKETSYNEIYKHFNFLKSDRASCKTCLRYDQASADMKLQLQEANEQHIVECKTCNCLANRKFLKRKRRALNSVMS